MKVVNRSVNSKVIPTIPAETCIEFPERHIQNNAIRTIERKGVVARIRIFPKTCPAGRPIILLSQTKRDVNLKFSIAIEMLVCYHLPFSTVPIENQQKLVVYSCLMHQFFALNLGTVAGMVDHRILAGLPGDRVHDQCLELMLLVEYEKLHRYNDLKSLCRGKMSRSHELRYHAHSHVEMRSQGAISLKFHATGIDALPLLTVFTV